ncbi:MAG TPA: hypothetical protein VK012_01050 [Gemmatimonadales bacterium]|nr:hypothetical protein [Gemmatimonadales bacterium]
MRPFPDDAELREFFGSEPAVLDPAVPWDSNVLSFESMMGSDVLECVIEPAWHTLAVRWVRDGRELVYLDLERVTGLEVDRYRGRDSLVVRFEPALSRGQVRIQLRPSVHVTWVTGDRTAESPSPDRSELGR